jgi:hypothetical protein
MIASPSIAQPPHINSMDISGNVLTIFGDVGYTPEIFIDSVSLTVIKSDTNYCSCALPDIGRGSEGWVYIGSRGYRSNAKLLTKWDLTVQYGIGCNYSEHYIWWYDIYSFLQGSKECQSA